MNPKIFPLISPTIGLTVANFATECAIQTKQLSFVMNKKGMKSPHLEDILEELLNFVFVLCDRHLPFEFGHSFCRLLACSSPREHLI
jgi:hypothetical protein